MQNSYCIIDHSKLTLYVSRHYNCTKKTGAKENLLDNLKLLFNKIAHAKNLKLNY